MRPLLLALAVLAVSSPLAPRAAAQDAWSDPFPGVRRLHRVTSNQDVNVLVVDLCAAGVSVRATGTGERRRTPSSFGELVGAQAVVNGDFFSFDTYSTDGVSMSGGAAWGGGDHGYVAPIAFGDHRIAMPVHEAGGAPEPWMREVVSGHPTILEGGGIRDNSGDSLCTNRHPRTALGLSADQRTLFLAVIDGRATGRIGMTCNEVATLLRDLGAHTATNLDGGGSSAMWLASAGVVNHPSDGRQRVVANHLAIMARGSGEAAHCPNVAPDGWLDAAGCDRIHGWARDGDAPTSPIDVHVYLGGPAGDPAAVGYPTRADRARDDLCAAIGSCEHAFELPVPHGFMDGVERPVFAYGIDATGGANTLLAGAPQTLRCDPPALPYAPRGGVLRHVASAEIFAAWRFDWNDIVTLDDATLATYAEGEPLPIAPSLARTESDPRVFVVDGALRRHVPGPAVMTAWRFAWDAIATVDAATIDALVDGAPIQSRPWLVRGSGAAVYLLDAPPPAAPIADAGPTSAPDARVGARDGGPSTTPRDGGLESGMSCAAGAPRGGSAWITMLGLALVLALRRERSARRGT